MAHGGAQETGSRLPPVIRSDVIVVGGGAMGSAAAWWLARRGRDVTLLEQYEQGHCRGSSHGGSRIFRLAYPDPVYINMAKAALPLWRELEEDAGRGLLETTGGLDHGDPGMVSAISAALRACSVTCQQLTRYEAAERWPMFRFDGPVCFQPDAGRCLADATVRALQDRATHYGAALHFEETAVQVEANGDGIAVTTPADRYEAPVAVIAAGAWVERLISSTLPLPPLTVTQEQPFHFAALRFGAWPSFIHYRQPAIYGLETPGEGIKVAEHHTGVRVDDLDRRTFAVDPTGRQRVIDYVDDWIPGLIAEPSSETTCLYTTTPSEDFVIDRRGPLVVAAGFSGHGFKFTPLVGRMLADLVVGGDGPGRRFALPGPMPDSSI
jgi:sarcosine oxidase